MKKIYAILAALSISLFLIACDEIIEVNSTDKIEPITENDSPLSTVDPTTSDQVHDEDIVTENDLSETTPELDIFNQTDSGYFVFEERNDGCYVIGVTDDAPPNIVIPDEIEGHPVIGIGSWALAYNTKIMGVTISNTVSYIGECAFEQCDNLENVYIGNGVTTIDKGAFRCCTSLSSIYIPSNVININESAFEGCSKLTHATIHFGVQQIGDGAFCATALTTVDIPNSVQMIGYGAFQSCTYLESVTIGTGITTISGALFHECANLNSIVYRGTKDDWLCLSFEGFWNECVPTTKVVCSDGLIYFSGNAEETIEPVDTEFLTTDNSSMEPLVTEPIATEPAETEPSIEPSEDVLIICDTQTINNRTIDTDVYITSTGVMILNNVTINGNIYCYGQLKAINCIADKVYAYAYGSLMSCGAYDGTHGHVSGGIKCIEIVILDDALDYAFEKWGRR
ncbi:MAG: leucine-rich repeat domain-containing protein [Clostridia bacterium]|nr:leucine-rich repeat domain-containing protein [Clostridia bacterium]